MVRAGEISPTELVRLHLERIERLDPSLNSFRVVLAERAMLEAEQAEARLEGGDERPLLGVPIALKDEVDLAGEIDTHGTDAFAEPGHGRLARWSGGCARPARSSSARRCCRSWRSAASPSRRPRASRRNPWDPQRTPGGSSGGSRRGGRRRPGPDRLGLRRRRLDPHPGRLLRPLRPQAAARPGLAGARPRALERALGQRLRQPHRARHGALARRRQRRLRRARSAAAARAPLRRVGEGRRPASCGSPARPPPRGRRAADRLRRGQAGGRRRRRRLLALARPRGRASATPTGAGSATTSPPRYLRGIAETSRRCRSPSGSNGAPAASAGSAA